MRQRSARGFTYLGLIILLTIIGLVGAAGLKMGSLLQRAAAEEELLEIGAQFSQALRSYAVATPQGQLQQPPSLQALLKDTRFPNPRRHLRKIFVDPVTGKAEWGIMYFGDNAGVIGVYSLSTRRPLKIANFDSRFVNMDNRDRISDWKFLRAGDDAVNPAQLMPGRGTMPASLFRPGALPNEGRSRDGQPLGHMPIAPPPEPAPAQETPVEEAKPDEGQPMGAPVEEAKEEEKEKEKEKEKDADEQQAQDDASGTSAEVK
jgi:type II secretory pathway pseudopilin PulG